MSKRKNGYHPVIENRMTIQSDRPFFRFDIPSAFTNSVGFERCNRPLLPA